MTATEARALLTAALATARPGCFCQVSPQALALVLAEIEQREGEADGEG